MKIPDSESTLPVYCDVENGQLAALTPRELEVLRLIAVGRSAKEAGKLMKIAPRTVERHIDHIRLKTRTRNRSHMVAYALAHRLLEDY